MIIISTHIKSSRIYGPARNAQKYVPRENFYVYSIHYKYYMIQESENLSPVAQMK